jgi:cell wall-associated NlpC family hydrolase
MRFIDMTNWYNKYLGIPYKHLGDNPVTGMDCFSLCKHVYQEQTGLTIPYASYEHCNIIDDDWFNKTTEQLFELGANGDKRWVKVSEPRSLDFILMSIGSTNITNHCALFLGNNRILHTMIGKPSWVSPYANYYKQYTTGIYRWTT